MRRKQSASQKRNLMEIYKKFFSTANFTPWLLQSTIFQKSHETPLARRLFSMHFLHILCIQKMFLRVLANFWYTSKGDMIRENYFNARESRFFDFRMGEGTFQYIAARQNVEDNKKSQNFFKVGQV